MLPLNILRKHLSQIKTPLGGDKIYKDECVYSFDNPESKDGLFVCMKTFLGFGKKHVKRHFEKTGNAVFLRIKRTRKEIPAEDLPVNEKPTKLAIGVDGGFQVDDKKFIFEEETSVVILPDFVEIPLPNQEIPDIVQLSAQGILAAEDAWKLEEAAAMAGTWEGEMRQKSKHADNLEQLENRPKIAPGGWKCEQCELTSNLWLNLTDGTILCGRRFFDGSGGNNHAVEHFNQVKHPLAVKLGTITADGADVYSYDEDDMVEDPHLTKHLAHFGINMAALEKTEKTMVELEIDLNQKIGEWDVIQEAGSKLMPLYGPGYTGMRNLGNSCYMNSVMQVLFTVPDFLKKYYDQKEVIFRGAPANCVQNFNVQMAKLGHGLLSGEYSHAPPEDQDKIIHPPSGIRPQMFKTLIGKGHPEFSTKRQQDSQEFFLHLVNLIERNSKGTDNPSECFRFEVEERVQCFGSGKVRYTNRPDFCLSLPVPVDKAVNLEEVAAYEAKKKELEERDERIDPKEIVRPKISLTSCLDAFLEVVNVDDFYSSALKSKTQAKQTTRMSSFPDYLMVQLKKFTVGYDWVPKKLDVSIDAPSDLDISRLQGYGIQPGEEELPQEPSGPQEPAFQIDENTVTQLVEMGFAREGCRKAVFHTKNAGAEVAMNWVMEHMADPDFSEPFQMPGGSKAGSREFEPDADALLNIMSMGFNKDQATRALKATSNNVERAIDWIFSHADELDQPMEVEETVSEPPRPTYRDGEGKYQLVAFISHMGTSTNVGHYVCHILKDGKWVIFNDEKVALSEHPPRDLAYLYLYQRV